jgi:hypothetical protein
MKIGGKMIQSDQVFADTDEIHRAFSSNPGSDQLLLEPKHGLPYLLFATQN